MIYPYGRPMPKTGQHWRHFKGRTYEIVCLARDAEIITRVLVIYKTDMCTYAREITDFMSKVKETFRFELVEETNDKPK